MKRQKECEELPVKIRLKRIGAKKRPFYRIVIANSTCSRDGRFIEIQGTAEGEPFDRALLDGLLDLALQGCRELKRLQLEALSKS